MARSNQSFFFSFPLQFLSIFGFLLIYQDLRAFGADEEASGTLKELAKNALTIYDNYEDLTKELGSTPSDQLKESHTKLKEKLDRNDYTGLQDIVENLVKGLIAAEKDITDKALNKSRTETDKNVRKRITNNVRKLSVGFGDLIRLDKKYEDEKKQKETTTPKPDADGKNGNSTEPEATTPTAKPDANDKDSTPKAEPEDFSSTPKPENKDKEKDENNSNKIGLFPFLDWLKAIVQNASARIQDMTNALKVNKAPTTTTTTTTAKQMSTSAATTPSPATTTNAPLKKESETKKKTMRRTDGGPVRSWVSSLLWK